MKNTDLIATFVHDALTKGRSREDIRNALSEAGWAENEVSAGLNAWAKSDFTPPVPRPRMFVTAREAFLYGLMFAALAMTAWHLTNLGFYLIDRWVPEIGSQNITYYQLSNIRWSIASLIVFFPLFIFMNMRAEHAIRKDPGLRRSLVRKWVGFITLFLAAIALLVDLIVIIQALLNGDLTLRFFAKTLLVAVVAGLVFLYFQSDLAEDKDAT